MPHNAASSFFACNWAFKMQEQGFLPDGRERLFEGIYQDLQSALKKIQSGPLSDAEKQAAKKQAADDAAIAEKRLDNPLNHY